ncbi:MAG: hypothetical protein ACNI27_03030 [Desulfovibrio sp.]
MSVTNIGSSFNRMNLYTDMNNSNSAGNAGNTEKAAETADEKKTSKKAQTYAAPKRNYGNSLREQVREDIDKMLEGVPLTESGKITFQAVFDYKKKLSDDFHSGVDADLKALGVDTETDFKLSFDSRSGTIVVGQHPDREKIMEYFADEDNKARTDEFKMITQYKELTDVTEKKLSPSQLRKELQAQSISAFMMNEASGEMFTGAMSGYAGSLSGFNMKV